MQLVMLSKVVEMARYANTVAAIPVTRKGGIPSMPTLEKVEEQQDLSSDKSENSE
jgi:sugar/nucleoside kinase (ribokinase family)